jgi:hypothetical protein
VIKNEKKSWVLSDDGHVTCFSDPSGKCKVLLTPATGLSKIHDDQLAVATKQINSILENTKAANKDASKCLAILDTPKGLLLAWVSEGMSATDEDEDELCRRLGI